MQDTSLPQDARQLIYPRPKCIPRWRPTGARLTIRHVALFWSMEACLQENPPIIECGSSLRAAADPKETESQRIYIWVARIVRLPFIEHGV